MVTEIEQRFDTESKMLPVLRERFADQVVRWVFSAAEIISSSYTSIWRCRGSNIHPSFDILPNEEGALYACGFDKSDRLVVRHEFDYQLVFGRPGSKEPAMKKVPLKNLVLEEFFSYKGDIMEATRVLRGDVQSANQLVFKDLLVTETKRFGDNFYQHTRFQYEGRKRILQQSISAKGQIFFEIKFGPHGEQTFFRVRRDGTRFQLHQPLPKGITLKSVKETIRSRLLPTVPSVVAAAKINEPIYCVALAYDGEGNDALPPTIAIGLDSERQHWLKEHGKEAWQWIWNPAEFYHFEKQHTQLEDEVLEEACDRLNSKLAEGDSVAPAVKILVEVAKELNGFTWPENVQRTSDFVVYAVDFELGSLRKNLKASLSLEQFTELKRKKLI